MVLVGIHVDDGIGAGDQYFQQSIAKLEQKFPFGSKKEGCFHLHWDPIDPKKLMDPLSWIKTNT